MKFAVLLAVAALAPSISHALTYDCKADDGTAAHFEFTNGAPSNSTLDFMGIHFSPQQMGMFLEDYSEFAGKGFYAHVSVVDYGTNGIIFDAKFLPNSATELKGTLSIFNAGPMKSVALLCSAK